MLVSWSRVGLGTGLHNGPFCILVTAHFVHHVVGHFYSTSIMADTFIIQS